MIQSDSDYTYALGERLRLRSDLEVAERDGALGIVFGETLRRNLARVTAEIEVYEASMKKSIGQMSFSERVGQEGFRK